MSFVFRLPLKPVAGDASSVYQLTQNSARFSTVQVNAANTTRLTLQPVCPGKITFKVAAGTTIPTDPSAPGSPALPGDLFLELTSRETRALGNEAPHLRYGLVFVYRDIQLPPSFFETVVVAPFRRTNGTFRRVTEGTVVLDTAAEISNAFARGVISVAINPGAATDEPSGWPLLTVAPGAATAELTFGIGIRARLNANLPPAPLTALSSAEILDEAGFLPVPLVFFYRVLRHLPRWQTLAADGHANHPLLACLLATDDAPPAPATRWRRLRFFLPGLGPRPSTSIAHVSLERLTARALPPGGGAPIWTAPLQLLGDIFVRRADGEAFNLELRDQDQNLVRLRRNPGDPDADALPLTWTAPAAGAEPEQIDATASVAPTGDPLALPFVPIPFGARDEGGLTVRGVGAGAEVIAPRELVVPLHQLLRTLGFTLGPATDFFHRPLSWALREFQIYAGMSTVAVESGTGAVYADRLQPVANPEPYTGGIHGLFDEATAQALRVWRQNNLRCPVVAEVWVINAARARVSIAAENVWNPDDYTIRTDRRTYIRDLTQYYAIPAHRLDAGRVLLGRYEAYPGEEGFPIVSREHQGVLSTPAIHTSWTPDTDVTPPRLVGRALAVPTPPADVNTLSTYKVISAVSVAEAEHTFDSLNGYDRAVMSMGVFHWTIFLEGGTAELPAFLALLRRHQENADPDEYGFFFQRFGIRPAQTWPALDAIGAPNPMYANGSKTWGSQLQQRGLRNDAGVVDAEWRSIRELDDANYLRTWHWFYRWVMANRLSAQVKRQQWYLGRLRLRAILNAPWPPDAAYPATPTAATIGQVYSSERMVTALLRAHVNAPGSVIRSGHVSTTLRNAYTNAQLPTNLPAQWTPAHITALQTSLEAALAAFNTSIRDTLPNAVGYNDPVFGLLATGQGSFHLDETDLP